MKVFIQNRPDDKDGVVAMYPETVAEAAELETFLLDGAGASLKFERNIAGLKFERNITGTRTIYFELYHDRGQERKPKGC